MNASHVDKEDKEDNAVQTKAINDLAFQDKLQGALMSSTTA